MNKPLALIGCCLLLVAPVAACQQHPVTEDGVSESVKAKVQDELYRQVGLTAASAWGWNPEDVVVEPLVDTGVQECRLLGLSSPGALPSHRRTVAVVDGEVVMSRTPEALQRVIDACGDGATAETWAEAVAAFGTPLPGYVVTREQQVSSVAHRLAMENGGYALHPPRFSRDAPGARAVEFFMTDLEGGQLFQVTATREGGGPVEVAVRPAGGS